MLNISFRLDLFFIQNLGLSYLANLESISFLAPNVCFVVTVNMGITGWETAHREHFYFWTSDSRSELGASICGKGKEREQVYSLDKILKEKCHYNCCSDSGKKEISIQKKLYAALS